VRRTDVFPVEGLSPDVEELPERVGAVDRRLGVDDPVGGVRVQPGEARASGYKSPLRGRRHLVGRRNADPARHLSCHTPDEDRQVRVDVKENLLSRLARNVIDLLAGRQQTRTRQRSACRDRNSFRPQSPGRCARTEVAQAGERGEWEWRRSSTAVSFQREHCGRRNCCKARRNTE
jgi:hypothetical protein